jgi:hypothetical protein
MINCCSSAGHKLNQKFTLSGGCRILRMRRLSVVMSDVVMCNDRFYVKHFHTPTRHIITSDNIDTRHPDIGHRDSIFLRNFQEKMT